MKKLLLVVFLFSLICNIIFGQDEKHFSKGNFITGGTIAYSSEKEKDFKPGPSPYPDVTYTTNREVFETHLEIGYFPLNHFAFGLKNELLFSSSKTTSDLSTGTIWDIHEKNFLIGPFIRYYIDPGIFFEGYSGFGLTKDALNDSSYKIKNFEWSAGIGYSLFLNRNVSIEPIVKYKHMDNNIEDFNEDISTLNLSFSIGFQIYLNVD